MARLKLHVTPGARREAIVGWRAGTLRLAVRARPERGRANEAALRLLAGRLGLPRAALRIIHGAASRQKLVEVDGLSQDDLQALLAAVPEAR